MQALLGKMLEYDFRKRWDFIGLKKSKEFKALVREFRNFTVNSFKERDAYSKVVALVRNGTLRRELVEAAFVWVRKKKYKERYPAVWFERCLKALAAREGIEIT